MDARRLSVATAIAAAVVLASAASAYDQYSEDRDATNCRACHGDFRANGYQSRHDGQFWSVVFGGQTYTSLHDVHRRVLLDSDCTTCHFPTRFPVLTRESAGGSGFPAIGCAGCHGRAEDESPGVSGFAAGLRQHHFRSGVTICASCHDDADPASYTPAEESLPPPYYFTPDPAHPNKPTDPCNPAGVGENVTAGPDALDNDGDQLYDGLDASCGNTVFVDGFETGDTGRWSSAVPLGDAGSETTFRAAASD